MVGGFVFVSVVTFFNLTFFLILHIFLPKPF